MTTKSKTPKKPLINEPKQTLSVGEKVALGSSIGLIVIVIITALLYSARLPVDISNALISANPNTSITATNEIQVTNTNDILSITNNPIKIDSPVIYVIYETTTFKCKVVRPFVSKPADTKKGAQKLLELNVR